jgi:hypothetical protein
MGEREIDQQERIDLAAQAAREGHRHQRQTEADGEVEGACEAAERRAQAAAGEEAPPEQAGGGEGGQLRSREGRGASDGEGQEDPEEEKGGRCEAAPRGRA